jgi:hypothetical protein
MDASQYEEFVLELVRQLEFCRNATISRNVKFVGKRQPGQYEIDIAVEVAFGGVARFLLIVECKNWSRPVDRPVVQKLAQTLDAIAAHKAAIASPVGFTKEAIEVAEAHGIALWVIAPGTWSVIMEHRVNTPNNSSPSRQTVSATKALEVELLLIVLRDALLKAMNIIATPPLLEVGLRDFNDVSPSNMGQPPFDNYVQVYPARPFLEPGLPGSVFNPIIKDAYSLIMTSSSWGDYSELDKFSEWREIASSHLKQLGVPEQRIDGVLVAVAGNERSALKSYLDQIAQSNAERSQFNMTNLLDDLKPLREDLITNKEYNLLQRVNAQADYERSFVSEMKFRPFLMCVEDVFGPPGGLGIAVGEILSGEIKKGDEVDMVWDDRSERAVVLGLDAYGKSREHVEAGSRIGIILRDMKRENLRRGMVLAKPGSVTSRRLFVSEIHMLTEEETGSQLPPLVGNHFQFYINGIDTNGTIHLPEHIEKLPTGKSLYVHIELQVGTAIYERQVFAIRKDHSTVGLGRVDRLAL